MICPAAWENSADRESSVFSTEKREGVWLWFFLCGGPYPPIPSGRARCPADKDSRPAARGAMSYLLHTTLSAPPRRKPHPDGIELGGSGRAAQTAGPATKQNLPHLFSVEKTLGGSGFPVCKVPHLGKSKKKKRRPEDYLPGPFVLPIPSRAHLPMVVRTISSRSRVVSSTVRSVQSSRTASWAAFSGATSRWLSL